MADEKEEVMEDWKKGFYESLLRFVRGELGKTDALEVTNVETETQERGYYERCAYSVTVINIYYRTDAFPYPRIAEWEGDFGELINRLT